LGIRPVHLELSTFRSDGDDLGHPSDKIRVAEIVGHPDVAQAAAIGISDERWGERPLLFVVPAGDQPPDVEELKSFIAEKVPKWWVRDQFEFVNELPIGATGKVLKRELRKNLVQEE